METTPSRPPRRRFSWPLAFTVTLLAAIALIAFIFFRVETWPLRTGRETTAELERLATKVQAAFVEIAHLQPQVRVNNRVYLEQTTPVAELAVLTRQIEVEHEFSHTWAGSTKRVKLHGTFLVKAGFDLREDVKANVSEDAITVELPHAQVLGVEQQKVEVQEYENGYWNRITAADVEHELATLPKLAREKAEGAGLAGEAEAGLRKQLTERIGGSKPLQLLFNGRPGAATPKP